MKANTIETEQQPYVIPAEIADIIYGKDILSHADKLDELLSSMEEIPDELAWEIKSCVQKEALEAVIESGEKGLVAAATGAGKSKIAIDYAHRVIKEKRRLTRVLICVPTEKLRDENWKDEFKKWKMTRYYNKNVIRVCHVSMNKIEGQIFDLVIMDEAHNITEANSAFFRNNTVIRCLALTATPPTSPQKISLLRSFGLDTVYELPLDTAIKLRMVAPYEIQVVFTRLNSKDKNIVAGNKVKQFMTTEEKMYQYHTNVIQQLMYNRSRTPQQNAALKYKILGRMHFIYGLESKLAAARKLISELEADSTDRNLVFCSNISQAEKLCANTFHSKSEDDKAFVRFKRGRINTLACVKSINEGHNIPVQVDNILVVQLNSGDLNLIQRMGRGLRYRKGHKARIILLVCQDTVDENWLDSATKNLDQSKIKKVMFQGQERATLEQI